MAELTLAKELADDSSGNSERREQLIDFICDVFAPAESLERILIEAYDYRHNAPKCELADVGVVMKALNALAKRQLESMAAALEDQFGCLEVIHSGPSLTDPPKSIAPKSGAILPEDLRRSA